MESLYDEYVVLTKEIEALEAKRQAIREQIQSELPEEGYKDERIAAFWKTVKKWVYSPAVESMVAGLKDLKKREETEGIAQAEEVRELNIRVK